MAAPVLLGEGPSYFPLRRQWTKPCHRMEHIPNHDLTRWEKEPFDFFQVSSIPARVVKKRIPVHLIWLPHTNQNYQPISNMPPKHARRFTSIPSDTGSLGGNQGSGVGRGAENEEDERDYIPLAVRRSSLVPQKRKAEAAPEMEPRQTAKAQVEPTATVAATKGVDQDLKNRCRVGWLRLVARRST